VRGLRIEHTFTGKCALYYSKNYDLTLLKFPSTEINVLTASTKSHVINSDFEKLLKYVRSEFSLDLYVRK